MRSLHGLFSLRSTLAIISFAGEALRPGGDSLTLRCSQWTVVFLDEGVICCKHGGVGVCARGGGAGRARNEGARVVLVAGVGVAAVGLRALYASPAPPTVLSPPQTRILPCGNSSSTTRLIPRGVSGCPQGGSSAVPGDFFIPRVAQASCGSAADAGPSVERAPRLWSPSASLGCSV